MADSSSRMLHLVAVGSSRMGLMWSGWWLLLSERFKVAQWKRDGPITHRSTDRNRPLKRFHPMARAGHRVRLRSAHHEGVGTPMHGSSDRRNTSHGVSVTAPSLGSQVWAICRARACMVEPRPPVAARGGLPNMGARSCIGFKCAWGDGPVMRAPHSGHQHAPTH